MARIYPKLLEVYKPKFQRLENIMDFARISAMEIFVANTENVAARLRFLREYFGLKQFEFAKTIGATPKQYNNWENGRQILPLHYALRIQQTYGISLDFLYLERFRTLPVDVSDAWLSSAAATSPSSESPVS